MQLQLFLAIFGVMSLTRIFWRISTFLTFYLRRSSLPRYRHENTAGKPFALITGATDGIGYGFALELASQNFNLILHGRNSTKLAKVKDQVLADYPNIEIRTWRFDAVKAADSFPESEVEDLVKGLNLTVLINNVGIGFEVETTEGHLQIINTNCIFTTLVTSWLLPSLIKNTPSLILNIGSDSDYGFPYLTTYSGTKGFIRAWSQGLASEMADLHHDIEIKYLCMATVKSARNVWEKVSLKTPTSRAMAKMSLNRVGGGAREGHSYIIHGLQRVFLNMLPEQTAGQLSAEAIRPTRKYLKQSRMN